ncbi:DUF1365 domain-containing protein [Antrihabitans sp. YC2-6]|uniref:DUF1365 domain-containing protein n=1 Tax=Antrihabitans sp. YC2-6 TaxID=2799498 RepID=UPI0018F51556|nr:DUF1365 domain-containing protein [Antrihabitans sp. YC2-6]MBJ8346777.1 DUF1365 domain-containing protein [Antrihabitans sp. YC2-6]
MTPALYSTRIRHVRTAPLRNEFEYRSYSWFVDVDELPRLPLWLRPFAQIRAADHLEPPGTDLRSRVETVLARNDIHFAGGRITALLNARVLGHVFNPLSVFWCRSDSGELRAVVAEVHNTYGQRHAYVVEPSESGRATTEKRFYVSPFNDVSGEYELSVPEPDAELAVRIVLRRDGTEPFFAGMDGTREPVTIANVVRAQLRRPVAPLAVSARIRKQGIALWARGLPVVPRPDAKRAQEVST